MLRFLISSFAIFFVLTLAPSLAEEKSTSGSCSPVIERTGGDVVVKCGKSDIEVEFIIKVVRDECENFKKQMDYLEENNDRRMSHYHPSLYPRFGNLVVSDIRDNKAVIYEYDKQYFIVAYRAIIDVDNLYNIAVARFKDSRSYPESFIPADENYFFSVNKLCTWSGIDLDIYTWMLKNGRNQNVDRSHSDLRRDLRLKLPPKPSQDLIDKIEGFWCAEEDNQFYAIHYVDEHIAGVTTGTTDGIFTDVRYISERRIWSTEPDTFNLITGFGSDNGPTSASDGYYDSKFSLHGDVLLFEGYKTVERDSKINGSNGKTKITDEEISNKKFRKCNIQQKRS